MTCHESPRFHHVLKGKADPKKIVCTDCHFEHRLESRTVVWDKTTGKLVARDDFGIGPDISHGQWSSPAMGKVGDKMLGFFGAGSGYVYAYEMLDPNRAKLGGDKPQLLKNVWRFNGHPLAQKTLGFAYADGLGVTQDYTKTVQWHQLAAEQGDVDAQNNLGFLYAQGRGVGQDIIEAHMWYNIAAAHGSASAAGNRDLLASRMNEDQIWEAERRALAWFDIHPEPIGSQ